MDGKYWILAALVWLLWYLVDARRKRPNMSKKSKSFKLLRDKPSDLKDVIYHPKEWRKPRK